MKFQLGAMSVGDILDRGLKLLLARLGAFFAIQFIFFLPIFAFQLMIVLAETSNMKGFGVLGVVGSILFLLLQPLSTAATVKIIADEYAGKPISTGAALSFAMTRFVPLLITSIMVGLIVVLGIFLLIVPGIIWALTYFFATQIVVLEKLDGSAAMTRSAALTAGQRGRIFWVFLLIGVIQTIIAFVLLGIQMVLPSYQMSSQALDAVPVAINTTNALINMAINFLVNVLVGSYQAICATLLYFDTRVRKEGYDLEMAAQNMGSTAESR